MEAPKTTFWSTIVSPPAARAGDGIMRWLIFGSLLVFLIATGGIAIVWPQWTALDGARAALDLQRQREDLLRTRCETVRAENQRLRRWDQNGRKVFLSEELARYPGLVRAVARRTGVVVESITLSNQTSERWRWLTAQATVWADEQRAETGDIQPQSVKLVLTGSFDQIYRSVAWLSGQQQLFIPDEWELREEGNELRLNLRATLFVIHEPADEDEAAPMGPPAPDTRVPVAMRESQEVRG
jgi:hypothetical protein